MSSYDFVPLLVKTENRNMAFLITLTLVIKAKLAAVAVNTHVRLIMREVGTLIKLSLRLCQLMGLLTNQRPEAPSD